MLYNNKDADPKTKRQIMNLVLVGAVATALFPNLTKDKTAEVVALELIASGLTVEGLDWQEMGVYNALNNTQEQQKRWKVSQYIRRRAPTPGTYPTMA